jgi:hypothetical protein
VEVRAGSIELRVLCCFDALMADRSVSLAARRLVTNPGDVSGTFPVLQGIGEYGLVPLI